MVRNIGFWIGKAFWGKGIATRALSEFLALLDARPLYAHVGKSNAGSLRVLEKCGFTSGREHEVTSDAPGETVEELILRLDAIDSDEAA